MNRIKRCSRCQESKVLSEYRQSASNKDGLQNYCRACHNLANKKWRAANRQKHLETLREWHNANRERSRELSKQWGRKNKEVKRMKDARRRAAIRHNGVYLILPKEWRKLYSSPCSACGSTNDVAADHIMPLARGGQHSVGNLQPLCKSCNSSKKDRFMVEWRKSLGNRLLATTRVGGN